MMPLLPTLLVVNELHGNVAIDDPGCNAALEELADGRAAAIAVVECPVVDVHPDERVGLRAIEATRITHRVVECVRPMLQSIRDAGAKVLGDLPCQLRAEVLAHDVAPKRER